MQSNSQDYLLIATKCGGDSVRAWRHDCCPLPTCEIIVVAKCFEHQRQQHVLQLIVQLECQPGCVRQLPVLGLRGVRRASLGRDFRPARPGAVTV
eukprot:497631-Hanusia_phi.AAC.1